MGCRCLRRRARHAVLALYAGLALAAGPASALTDGEARHLLVRTGFGASAAEIDRLLPLDRGQAVDLLLEEAGLPSSYPLPVWADDNPMIIRGLPDPAVADALLAEQGASLKAWWIGRMLISPTPLRERMTLFWHGHFATALGKVRSAQLMLRQNGLIRRHALGDFQALLTAMVTDPAMLIYLDGAGSTAAAPNENFAREVMELFVLGVGSYGEADIRAAARALTGWVVHPATGDAVFVPARHDGGDKTLFGETGPWGGEDVVRILLAQPAAARFVAGELWAEFVSLPPSAPEVDAVAATFRDGGWQIAPVVRAILTSDAFWRPEERGSMIAGPVEWTVGTLRLLDAFDTPPEPVAELAAALGQDLFDPPNVAGWPGDDGLGEAWIAPATLARRLATVQRFIAGRRDTAAELDLAARRSAALVRWLDGLPYSWRGPERLQALVLPIPPAASGGDALPVAASPDPEVLADLVRGWLADPAFQLK
jgi:uncharacterized protein (DUF1800 family)